MTEQLEQDKIPNTQIRPATTQDLPAIENILRKTVQDPGSGDVDENEVGMELERITNALASSGEDATLVAQKNTGETLGFAFFGSPDLRITAFTGSKPEETLELKLLYVDPDKRSKGVGTQLIGAVEEQARIKGKTKVELTSGPRYISIGAGEFYEKKGYRLVGTIRRYFEGKYWARVFQKELE